MTLSIIIDSKAEFWVQALYGKHWEDFEETETLEEAFNMSKVLRKERQTGSFRVVEKTTSTKWISEELP